MKRRHGSLTIRIKPEELRLQLKKSAMEMTRLYSKAASAGG